MSLQGKRGRGRAARNEAVDGLIVEARRGLAAASDEKRVTAGAKRLSPRDVLEALLIRQGIDIDHPAPGKRVWVRCEVCKIPVKNAKNGLRRLCAAHAKQRAREQKGRHKARLSAEKKARSRLLARVHRAKPAAKVKAQIRNRRANERRGAQSAKRRMQMREAKKRYRAKKKGDQP